MSYFDDMMDHWSSDLPINSVSIQRIVPFSDEYEVFVGHIDNEGNILRERSIEMLFSRQEVEETYQWFTDHMPHAHQYIC